MASRVGRCQRGEASIGRNLLRRFTARLDPRSRTRDAEGDRIEPKSADALHRAWADLCTNGKERGGTAVYQQGTRDAKYRQRRSRNKATRTGNTCEASLISF